MLKQIKKASLAKMTNEDDRCAMRELIAAKRYSIKSKSVGRK